MVDIVCRSYGHVVDVEHSAFWHFSDHLVDGAAFDCVYHFYEVLGWEEVGGVEET